MIPVISRLAPFVFPFATTRQNVQEARHDDRTPVNAMLKVLRGHNWKEENLLYRAIDQRVSTRERDDVFVRMGKG